MRFTSAARQFVETKLDLTAWVLKGTVIQTEREQTAGNEAGGDSARFESLR
jgi:hypothetical protein